MNIERTHHIGHYGVIFTVIRFTVVPDNRHALTNLCLLEAKTAARQVRDQIRRLYEKMLARDLPCEMASLVGDTISGKLRRYHAGDIIIGLDASVRGGTGPQRSTLSMHVYSDES